MKTVINVENHPELLNGSVANVVLTIDGEKHMFYSALQAYVYLTSEDEEHRTSVARCVDQSKIRFYFSTPKSGYNDPYDLKAMKRVLVAKFVKGHPYFKEQLLATGDNKIIVEDKAKSWNVKLSKLLTGLRDALKEAEGEPSKKADKPAKKKKSEKADKPLKSKSSDKTKKKVKKDKPEKPARTKPAKSEKAKAGKSLNRRPKRRS